MNKLWSRKLGVEIATLVLVYIQANQDAPWYVILSFVIAGSAYIIGQSYVDAKGANNRDEVVDEILTAVREAARVTEPDSDDG
jgi:hypothetical protein